jgi:hypothetical protein
VLTAIVVSQRTRLPADGWLPGGAAHLSAGEKQARFEAERDRIFACKEWEDLLKELGLAAETR